jgi:hypothetical protein
MPRACQLCVVTLSLAAVGCGGSTPSVAPSTAAALHGEVSDPIGDALPVPGVSVTPDLVHGTADATSGSLTFTIQFAPGTFDRTTTRVTIELDTDQALSTGINTGSLGIDYSIDLWARTGQATISRAAQTGPSQSLICTASNPCYVNVGVASITFVTDGMQATVPLSLLGNVSGRLNFRIGAYVSPQTSSPTIVSDMMPDNNLPPGRVQ